jgi:hypothetical protein
MATKKMIFAISIAVPAIPPKPRMAATIATIRNVMAQPSMPASLWVCAKTPMKPEMFP